MTFSSRNLIFVFCIVSLLFSTIVTEHVDDDDFAQVVEEVSIIN